MIYPDLFWNCVSSTNIKFPILSVPQGPSPASLWIEKDFICFQWDSCLRVEKVYSLGIHDEGINNESLRKAYTYFCYGDHPFSLFLKTKEYTHKLGDGFSNSFLKNLNSCFKVIDTWFYVCECVCVCVCVCVCSVRNLYAMMEIKRNMGTEYGFLGLRSWLSFSTMLCSVGSCWSLDGPYSFWVTHIKYPLFSCTSLTAFST